MLWPKFWFEGNNHRPLGNRQRLYKHIYQAASRFCEIISKAEAQNAENPSPQNQGYMKPGPFTNYAVRWIWWEERCLEQPQSTAGEGLLGCQFLGKSQFLEYLVRKKKKEIKAHCIRSKISTKKWECHRLRDSLVLALHFLNIPVVYLCPQSGSVWLVHLLFFLNF